MNNLTKEQKALAIARAEGWDYAPNNFSHESDMDDLSWYIKDNTALLIGKLIEFYSSFNYLMPIVERINNEYRYKNGRYYFKFDYELVNIIDRLQIDSWFDGMVEHYDSYFLLDALLDAVYYVLVESKELK